MSATLFRDVYLLDGSMEKALHADLLVRDGKISKIAASCSLKADDAEIVDGKGQMLLMPGFFNAHSHAAMTLLRGLGEERPLMEWLEQRIWPVEAHLNADIVYAGTLQALCEMALTGTTGVDDMYFYMEEVARAVKDSGMRAGVGIGVSCRDRETFNRTLFKDQTPFRGKKHSLVLDPHAPYTVPFDLLCEVAEKAKEWHVPVQFHFLEAPWERGHMTDTLKMTPIEYLEKSGLAEVEHVALAHGVQFLPEEFEWLAAHPNITITHCPASNMKLGSGFAPVPAMVKAGVQVALGTDGAASNNRLDMWGELRLASLIHKGCGHDSQALNAGELLTMATYKGACSIGLENVGMIREGWEADLTAVDLTSPRYLGADEENLASYVVYAGGCEDVLHVMCGGDWVVKDRRFSFMPVSEVKKLAALHRDELLRAAGC